MKTKTVMIQGTGSDVGKTVLTAGLCRVFSRKGYNTAPFKSQNMALNSYITIDEKEIGRAQAMQAEAAGIEPETTMNPVLLKPNADNNSQVVIEGKPYRNMTAKEYFSDQHKILSVIRKNLNRLLRERDIVVIEGGGSPAEINLQDNDLVNMKIARMADAPVILTASIEKGGVFASIVGTLELLPEKDKERIKGIIINKFRGEVKRFESGIEFIEKYTGIPVLGVLPYFEDLNLPEEDSLGQKNYSDFSAPIKIAVIDLPHISNFTDFDYLGQEPGCELKYVHDPGELNKADLIIIPGSKNTISDLKKLYQEGTAATIKELADKGVMVIGICGGFQMLGQEIRDPEGIETGDKKVKGLGLLDITTTFVAKKITSRVEARSNGNMNFLEKSDFKVKGYEIHQGRTQLGSFVEPVFKIKRKNRDTEIEDGAVNKDGSVWGTYLHDLFSSDGFRKQLLNYLRKKKGLNPLGKEKMSPGEKRIKNYEKLADELEKYLDMDLLDEIVSGKGGR
ncbi:MAG: cobyric acid synthase [Bacillota bacterium]